MKYKLVIILFFVSLSASSQNVKKDWNTSTVREVMIRVGWWQINQQPRYVPLDWHTGTLNAGLMALYQCTGDKRFYEYLITEAEKYHWSTENDIYDADRLMVAQTYMDLFDYQKDSIRLRRTKWVLDAHLERRPHADVRFTDNAYRREWWSWCDALFMAPPAFAKMYRLTGNKAYLDYLVSHWWKTSDYLFDKEHLLFYRDDRFFDKQSSNGRKVFWSRGNGWVLAALARILTELPPDFPDRHRFEKQFVQMTEEIVPLQGDDGLWRASLLDYEQFPAPESSSTALFCYAIAWGLNVGLLNDEKYTTCVRQAWLAMAGKVNEEGRLGYVQPPGIEPKPFTADNWEPYGTGAFLLAGSEVIKLLGK